MKTISVDLTESGINRALQELQEYKRTFNQKVETFRARVADEIQKRAAQGFDVAIVDDLLPTSGTPIKAQVSITVEAGSDGITAVIASGADAIWVEFGAGVYHNGSAGSSPHPDGATLGYTIGSYGMGYGKRKVWGYKTEDGRLILTHGTPAEMPLYTAAKEIADSIEVIAHEVFA